MKKTFKLTIVLILSLLIMLVLSACGECQHRDANGDLLCDKCGEEYTDIQCSHVDADDNGTCDKCAIPFTDGEDVPKEHIHVYEIKSSEDKYSATPGDCLNAPEYYYSCACGEVGSEVFAYGEPLGHIEVISERIEPTCTESGLTEGTKCQRCEEPMKLQAIIPAEGHDEVEHEAKAATCTETGYTAYVSCSKCDYTTFSDTPPLGHIFEVGACSRCGDDEPPPYVRDGDYIYFGEYPQTVKRDGVKIDLNTKDFRGYYLGYDGYYYAAVTAAPCGSEYTFTTDATVVSGTVYYFRVEPIKWRILYEENGEALLMCDSVIANMPYQPSYIFDDGVYYTKANGAPIGTYQNIYKYSEVRRWLNDDFLSLAFGEKHLEIILTSTVDNGTAHPDEAENTEDRVFIPSYKEVAKVEYGFVNNLSGDPARRKQTSDYARATGAWMSTEDEYYGNGWWWLRSPCDWYSYGARDVYRDGRVLDGCDVLFGRYGVVPALRIRL